MYGLISFNLSGSSRWTQSRTSFEIASLPVRIASKFLLKALFRVSVKRKLSAASTTLPDGVVSVFEEVFVAGLERELYER